MVRDSNLFFRAAAAGNLTATETTPAIKVKETPIKGLALNVLVPRFDVGDTLDIVWFESTDGSAYVEGGRLPQIVTDATVTSTTPKMYRTRISSRGWYLRMEFRTAGTSPNFGAVQSWLGDHDYMNNFTTGVPATLHEV